MKTWKLAPLVLAPFLLGNACTDLFKKNPDEVIAPGISALKDGDLLTAYDALDKARADNASLAKVQSTAAYTYLLAGEYDKADNALAAAEAASSGDEVGKIKLRRALVALRAGNLDAVKEHGVASGLDAGKVLAAEVHLADAESDEAIALLKSVNSNDAVGQTAAEYLKRLESGDQFQASLAEATALWAIGQRGGACEQAGDLVGSVESESKGMLLLLWAGRAVTSNRVDVAASLLDEAEFATIPQEQAWRRQATLAIVHIAKGEYDEGVALFDALASAGAPADGIADARATAAALCKDKAVARQLVEGLESAAVGRSLLEAGAGKAAKDQTPSGALRRYMEGR